MEFEPPNDHRVKLVTIEPQGPRYWRPKNIALFSPTPCVNALEMGASEGNKKYSRRNQCPSPLPEVPGLRPPASSASDVHREKIQGQSKPLQGLAIPCHPSGHQAGPAGLQAPLPPEGPLAVAGAALLPRPPPTQVPGSQESVILHNCLLLTPYPRSSLLPSTETSTSYIPSPHLLPQPRAYHPPALCWAVKAQGAFAVFHPSAHQPPCLQSLQFSLRPDWTFQGDHTTFLCETFSGNPPPML